MRRLLLVVGLLAIPAAAFAQQAETIEYYGTDAIGSIRIVWDGNGNVIARQDFTPFGEPVLQQGTAIPKQGFVGNETDAETNQDYFYARMFEARTGRFTRTDPIEDGVGEPQAWNRYAYGLNNPFLFRDATGLKADPCADTTYDSCVVGHAPNADPDWEGGYEPCPWYVCEGGGGSNASDSGDSSQDGGGGSSTQQTTTTTTTVSQGDGNTKGKESKEPTVAEACIAGAEGFVDGVIPFGDPLQSHGLYDPKTPGLSFSLGVGATVRDFAVGEYASGVILSYAADVVAGAARARNPVAKLISNNRYVRLGLSYMGRGPKSPALRFGSASSDVARYLSHIDLTPDFNFSVQLKSALKSAIRVCKPKP